MSIYRNGAIIKRLIIRQKVYLQQIPVSIFLIERL